jgi:hypothetical protein
MHFAHSVTERIKPEPQLKGACCICGEAVIAKCGNIRIWHWSHLKNRKCDKWWEQETEWHRNWKDKFPDHWQEFILQDENTGEKHIADIRTDNCLVIEFQHSHIDPQERIARETFYKNMVWVIDSSRLKGDYQRFQKWKSNFWVDMPGIFRVYRPELAFGKIWTSSKVPVVFDFLGTSDTNEAISDKLYCLLPQTGVFGRLIEMSRQAFIKSVSKGDWSKRVEDFINQCERYENSNEGYPVEENAVSRFLEFEQQRKSRR